MNPHVALQSGFQLWIEEVTGANESANTRPGTGLDPYGTSLRRNKALPASLAAIEAGTPIPGIDWSQRVRDVRATDLCSGPATGPSLTPLGDAVLQAWRGLGVDNDSDDDELPRALVLAREGLHAHVDRYIAAFNFWRYLRNLRSPDDWLADPFALHVVSYLNQDDANGFNPFEVLAALRFDFSGGRGAWSPLVTTPPSGWTKTRLDKLLDVVDGFATRSRGRVQFVRALELLHLASTKPDVVDSTLSRWGV